MNRIWLLEEYREREHSYVYYTIDKAFIVPGTYNNNIVPRNYELANYILRSNFKVLNTIYRPEKLIDNVEHGVGKNLTDNNLIILDLDSCIVKPQDIFPIGTRVSIVYMEGEPAYKNRKGTVVSIDDIGQIHGTWGGLAINLKTDIVRKV